MRFLHRSTGRAGAPSPAEDGTECRPYQQKVFPGVGHARKSFYRRWNILAALLLGATTAHAQIPELAWTPRSDWVNVKEHAVVGDGLADDTVALQALLDTVKSGMTFYFPPGDYRITKTLTMTGPALGVSWLGHGRTTRLFWDGEEDGRMLKEDGFAQNARYEGFIFDGQGRAAVGFWHFSSTRFETEELHRNMAFRGFREAGIRAEQQWKDKGDKYATAEIVIQNCLFEDCGVGVWFGSFNDYNYTFEGCEFRRCGTGIQCAKGNFYVRNTHFEGSTRMDIDAGGEHGCSVRRVTSWGSKKFLHHWGVKPMVVEDCQVGGWKDSEGSEGAVTLRGAPVLMVDCVFSAPPDGRAPIKVNALGQNLLLSNCRVEGEGPLFNRDLGDNEYARAEAQKFLTNVTVVAAGEPRGHLTSPHTSFLKDTWPVSGRVFDAVVEFGAKADGHTDDSLALQQAIDAAREAGAGAIAYLPMGRYVITNTLRMTGANYTVGGCGPFSRLLWRGEAGGTMLAVDNPDHLRLENILIGHHDAGPGTQGVDILHTASGPSFMTYEAVFVFGMYQKKPFEKGLQFRNLPRGATVVLDRVNGNLRFTDCGDATVFAPVSYEGSLVVEGREGGRTGFMGFQTRLSTVVERALVVRDNHSIVMSDFFVEQADGGWSIEGGPGLPPGRVVIQAPKVHLNERIKEPVAPIQIRDYAGEIVIGPVQFYLWPKPSSLSQRGQWPLTLALVAGNFYETTPDFQLEAGQKVRTLGMVGLPDTLAEAEYPVVQRAFDDLRRLGQLDLQLQHGGKGMNP